MSRDLFKEYGIKPPKNKKPVDLFEQEDIYIPKESKGWGGVGSDALNKAVEIGVGLPGALMELPGEIAGAGKQAFNDPRRAMQNLGAGFGNLGHGVLSSLGNTRDYLEKKDIVSKEAPSFRLPESVLPKDYNYAEALGVQGKQPGDAFIQGLPTAAALAPASELGGLAKAGFNKIKPSSPYKYIQKMHDVKEKALSDIFKDVSHEANLAEIKIELPDNLIAAIKKIGPQTDRFASFVDKAKAGDYGSLRKLQSELYLRGKGYKSSIIPSEAEFGDLIFEQRSKLNEAISDALYKSGRPDLAHDLNIARKGWNELEKTYHANPTISKLVGQEREVPFSTKPLRKESAYTKRLKEENPKLERKLKNSRRLQVAGGLLAGTVGGYKALNAISGKRNNYYDYSD